jgi:hypothetical protein
MLPLAARLPSAVAHRLVLMLRWWWSSAFDDDDKVLLLWLSGNRGWVLLMAGSVGVWQFRRKSSTTCVGAGGDGAFGCRLPPWRRRCEASAPSPILEVLSPGENLIRRAEVAMAASSMSLLC